MAAPVIESSTDISELGATSFVVTKPTGLAVNDLLLAIIAKDDDVDMNGPAGWTEHSFVGGDYSSYYIYKVADAGDVAATDFTFTGDREDYVGRLYRISGIDTASPIDAVDSTGSTGTSSAPQAAALTTNTDDALVFVHAGMDDNDVPYSLDTAGWTTDHNTSVTTAGIVIGTKTQATAGSTGIVDFTTNASDGWAASQIAIKPAGGGGTTVTVTLGTFGTFTGQALTVDNVLTIADASFGFTEQAVNANYSISILGATFGPFTGQALDVNDATGISDLPASFNYTGQALEDPTGGPVIETITAGSFSYSEQQLNVKNNITISADSFGLSAQAVQAQNVITIAAATFGSFVGQAVDPISSVEEVIAVTSFNATAQALSANVDITPVPASFTFIGKQVEASSQALRQCPALRWHMKH